MKTYVVTCQIGKDTIWYELNAADESEAESLVKSHDPDIEKIIEVREAEDPHISEFLPSEGSEG